MFVSSYSLLSCIIIAASVLVSEEYFQPKRPELMLTPFVWFIPVKAGAG